VIPTDFKAKSVAERLSSSTDIQTQEPARRRLLAQPHTCKVAGMEAEFPQSAREAEEHVRQIRRDKGLGDGPEQIGNNASDLESALEL
jgi:hypothetical protein